ncbi:MAG: hypothetical protein CM15mP34_2280 [Gammaproteobacteria bacterium]|nr:MAG: hypothetical protein CM15mP34_2280 [Gammaproteobacteria bacterium]
MEFQKGGYIGTFTPWPMKIAVDTGYADGSDWFFQIYSVQQQFQFVQVLG